MTASRRYHGTMDFPARSVACALRAAPAGLLAAFSCAAALAQPAPAAEFQPLLRALNAVRAQGCERRPAAPPLREHPQLSAAAARIAAGARLGDAVQSADYRAQAAAQISLSGYSGPAAIAQGAAANFCGSVIDPTLTEAGFHQRGLQTWIVLAAPFAPPAAAQEGKVQERVLELVNAARAKPRRCGSRAFAAAPPLRLSPALRSLASAHADDMARHSYFSHTGRDGSRVSGRATRARYPWQAIGENIAAGQQTPEAVVEGWVRSPGHCANIMSPDYAEMGAAYAVNNRSTAGIYWVQVFGTPRRAGR